MSEIDNVVNVASEEVGYLEKSWAAYNENPDVIYDKTAGAGNDNVTKYAKEMDDLEVYNGPKQGYAWCKVFVDWVLTTALGLDRAGQLLYGWTAGVTQAYNWFRDNGQIANTPKIGDLIIFGDCDHIGIVVDYDDSRVYTIEGNTSGATGLVANGGGVAQKSYSRWSSYIKCYARPEYDGEPGPPTPPEPGEEVIETVKVDTPSGLNIRAGASTDYAILGAYPNGTILDIYEITSNWGRTKDGWICLDYTTHTGESSNYVLGLYVVNTPSGLNVRSGPGTNYEIIKAYPDGTRFDTYEIDNNWARTPSGWVCLDYCELIEEY